MANISIVNTGIVNQGSVIESQSVQSVIHGNFNGSKNSITISNEKFTAKTLQNVKNFKLVVLDRNGKETDSCEFPAGTEIYLNVISVEGIKNINTQTASVTVEKCTNIGKIETKSGSVKIENCKGSIGEISTLSGSIRTKTVASKK